MAAAHFLAAAPLLGTEGALWKRVRMMVRIWLLRALMGRQGLSRRAAMAAHLNQGSCGALRQGSYSQQL